MSVESSTIGGVTLRVVTASEGPGVPLLYLHGFEHHPGEASFLQTLGAGRRVIAPEHPGYGESTGTEELEDVLDIVLFYREFVESLGVDQVDVVGHCLGGMLAAELAAISPHAVRRLVLVAPYGLWLVAPEAVDPFTLAPRELAIAKWHDPELAATEPSIFQKDPSDPALASIVRSQNLAIAAKYLWPFPDRGLRRRLRHIKAKSLIVHGESDGLLPVEYAHEFTRLIPDARLEEFAEAGHLPLVERETEACAAVLAFLDEA